MSKCTLRLCVDPSKVRTLFSPAEFYEQLMTMYGKSKKRAVISSLYIGTGKYSSSIVSTLLSTLKSSVGGLQVDILMDRQRGSRREEKDKGCSSLTQCIPLLAHSEENVRVSLFHNPLLGRWLHTFLPSRINELLGVMHIKAFISDNTTVLSGANLSDSYLYDRQDRYIVVQDETFSNAIQEIIQSIQEMSFSLHSDMSIHWESPLPNPINFPDLFKKSFTSHIQSKFQKLKTVYNPRLISSLPNSSNFSSIPSSLTNKPYPNSNESLPDKLFFSCNAPSDRNSFKLNPNIKPLNSSVNKHDTTVTTSECEFDLDPFAMNYNVPSDSTPSCIIHLCMQAGFSDPPIMDELNLICKILKKSAASSCSPLVIASGYLNLPKKYLTILQEKYLNSFINFNYSRAPQNKNTEINATTLSVKSTKSSSAQQLYLFTASPSANSFFLSKGPSYYIPSAYACVAEQNLSFITQSHRDPCNLFEYTKKNWTFHSKGIWIYTEQSPFNGNSINTPIDPSKLPCSFFQSHSHNKQQSSNLGKTENQSSCTSSFISDNSSINNIFNPVDSTSYSYYSPTSQLAPQTHDYHHNTHVQFTSLPEITVIGSSNYGQRAVWRDLEMSYCIQSNDSNLQNSWQKEVDNIIQSSQPVSRLQLRNRFTLWLKLIVIIFGKWFL